MPSVGANMKVNKCSEFYPKKKIMYVVVYKNSHYTKNRRCFAKLDQGKGFSLCTIGPFQWTSMQGL